MWDPNSEPIDIHLTHTAGLTLSESARDLLAEGLVSVASEQGFV